MKKTFNSNWKASKQPRKQRKFLAKAPLHIRKKFLSVNLSKELRKKHQKRNLPIRKGDVVKIMRGKFKKKQGKVTIVNTKLSKIIIEGIQVKKIEGSKVNAPMRPSNLQIIELNTDDRKRSKSLIKEAKKEQESKSVKTNKEDIKQKGANK